MGIRDEIEKLIDTSDPEILQDLRAWDKGDRSEVGICEILLKQLIKKHRQENGEWSNTDYDIIKLRY